MNILKRIIPGSFKDKIKSDLGVPNQKWGLEHLKELGFQPDRIVDIGAYEGEWTGFIKSIFPEAEILMIEAQNSKESRLQEIAEHSKGSIKYGIFLLAAADNMELTFNEYETASSVLTEHFSTESAKTTKIARTLDAVLPTLRFSSPDFIKLDVQGYELEVLKGAKYALKSVQAILMEVSFIDIYKNCPLILDVLNFMDNEGFQLYDICSLMRRPIDRALYQSDLLFLKKTSPILNNKKWTA